MTISEIKEFVENNFKTGVPKNAKTANLRIAFNAILDILKTQSSEPKEDQFTVTDVQENQLFLVFTTTEKPIISEFILLYFRGVLIPTSDFTVVDKTITLNLNNLSYKAEKGDTISIFYKYNKT